MIPKLNVRRYCEIVFLAGCGAVALMAPDLHVGYVEHHPLTAILLASGVVFAEFLPVKIPRRGEDEEITLSSSFVMALLLAGGLLPALVAQCVAGLIQDLTSRKALWRARFNLGQYAISLVAGYVALKALGAAGQMASSRPFGSAELPAVLLSAVVFFVVNTGVVGTAVSLYQGIPVARYFRNGLSFVFLTAGVLLLLAPVVIATAAYSAFLIPLLVAPILTIHRALWQGARSEHAARHDALTGLPNRATFHEVLQSAVEETDTPACVMLMDLDRFKEVNDTLGHHYGDLLLQQVAQRLRDRVRSGDRIARLGGDEFATLCNGCRPEEAMQVAREIIEALRPPFELEGTAIDVQGSIGIAVFPDHGGGVDTLLQKADVAMYRAKAKRAGVVLYEERHDHHSPDKLKLAADLRAALEREEIIAFYQPELDLVSSKVRVVEALARWVHPELGMLPPVDFLEIAEQTGLMTQLSYRILEVALAQVRRWRRHPGLDLTVAVNISASVLVEHDFVANVLAALEDADVAPRRLKLEVTESALMTEPDTTRKILQELHSHGIEIAIDDFGTGYSSLSYLADLPVSEVKIDRSFVMRMQDGRKEAIIVNSTIDLAQNLGMRAVAEGVEDEMLLPRLRALGCDVAQGYAISRPISGEEMTHRLADLNPLCWARPLEVQTATPAAQAASLETQTATPEGQMPRVEVRAA